MRGKSISRSRAGGLRFFFVCAVFFARFSPSAMAIVSVNITSPTDGALFHPGDAVPVTASFSESVAGVDTFTITLEDSMGGILDGFVITYHVTTLQDTVSDLLDIPVLITTPQTLTVRAVVVDRVDPTVEKSVSIVVRAFDSTPPTYTGHVGIISASRPSDNTEANLTWGSATDDTSAASAIRYNVYASTTQAAVFSGSPVKVFTGVTLGQITGLDPHTHYYFGVRAEDEAGNEETNTNTALARYTIEPAYGKIVETFDYAGENAHVLDDPAAEAIGTAATSLFAWGGFDAGTGGGGVSMSTAEGLRFFGTGKKAGSYAYTRFGKPSLPGGLNNAAEEILDMTGNRARAAVQLNTLIPAGYDVGSTVALMIRDNLGWWQSSGMALEENPSTANTAVFQFNGPSAVTWNHLLGTFDMDEVDDGGETTLEEGTAGTPNLGKVEGMGILILEGAANPNPLFIRSLTLHGPAPTVTAADRQTWNLYR